jgi:hypothetical protein
MGQGQSQDQSSTSKQQSFYTAVQQLAPASSSQSQIQILEQLSPAEKRQLKSALQQQNKNADAQIKQILKQAKSKASSMGSKKKAKDTTTISPKEKSVLLALPPEIAAVTEKKIEKVLEKKDTVAKKLVSREINKAKNICKEWKKNKKENPAKPTNPESNRPVTAGKATYTLIDKVCKTKSTTCKQPKTSPFRGHRAYKDTSRKGKIIQSICLSRIPRKKKSKA